MDVDFVQDADQLFVVFTEDNHVTIPMDKIFFGSYFGMFAYQPGISEV
ncbi:hypothetical protein [Carboxylicivirga linearis]|uniref:Uncharacterized protein n=1 Tax=Carboxylicivirga linearis TaxID=1628157 RepID=A0ABS5JRK2_9BACT|nr:hypothetical protein [Carboxylicivirga linearis]MBS2097445.1 hypothetical protein [Carboxylicivirga linearis]